jgi:hypothetical protein
MNARQALDTVSRWSGIFARWQLGARPARPLAELLAAKGIFTEAEYDKAVSYTRWQDGAPPAGDPEAAAVAEHREQTIMLTVQVRALTELLAARGLYTDEEYDQALAREAAALDEEYAAQQADREEGRN